MLGPLRHRFVGQIVEDGLMLLLLPKELRNKGNRTERKHASLNIIRKNVCVLGFNV